MKELRARRWAKQLQDFEKSITTVPAGNVNELGLFTDNAEPYELTIYFDSAPVTKDIWETWVERANERENDEWDELGEKWFDWDEGEGE